MRSRERTGAGDEALFLSFIVLFWFVQYLITPYLTIFLMDRGTTAFAAGVVAGAYGFVQILVRMPVGAALRDGSAGGLSSGCDRKADPGSGKLDRYTKGKV